MRLSKPGGWTALCVVVAFALPVAAQGLPETGFVQPERRTGPNLDIPPPPRAVIEADVPQGRLPPIPIADSGLAQPAGPPVSLGEVRGPGPQAGAFTFFRNRDHRPVGRTQLNPGEPATAQLRDVWFATGNTYGSLSIDSGMTWALVNPYTLFPATDGGVCCDQRVVYVPRHDITVWYIQYRYSSTTGKGGARIAVSRGRADLRDSVWYWYYLDPVFFGLGSGLWLDFPDLAFTNDWLYCAANVYTAGSSYSNSLVWRLDLADMAAGSAAAIAWYRRSGGTSPMGGGFAYRFTQTFNGNPGSQMFWCSHNSTASVRLFQWLDGSGARAADVDRAIAAWTPGTGSSIGPDGRDWLGFDDHRIQSGYLAGSEGGFLWGSNANGTTRPQSYVRVCRFNTADRSILSDDDIWSPDVDLSYPACGVNSLGHKGVVLSIGSSTLHVHTVALLVDNYRPGWFSQQIFGMALGTNGAPSNRWGDYHQVVADTVDSRTFLGTGMEMSGGAATINTVHRTAWFGRDDYTPSWVTLSVNSTPVSGIPISVVETDINGFKDGVTSFTRTYTPRQGYTLTAPETFTIGPNDYLFDSWSGTGGTTTSRTYEVADIGVVADVATANYGLETFIIVDDRNVAGGVPIGVGSVDLDGRGDGVTSFTRRYKGTDAPFAFTAPSFAGLQPFRRWYVDGLAQPIGVRTINVVPSLRVMAVEAEYCMYEQGSYSRYGFGCRGSNGLIPLHDSTSRPDLLNTVTHTVSGLYGATPAAMFLGFSRTMWSGLPLPLSLGFVGANPACSVLAEGFLVLPMTIGGAGSGSYTFRITGDPAAIGQSVFTQVIAADVFLPDPIPLVVSNGLAMTIGGSSIGGQRCP